MLGWLIKVVHATIASSQAAQFKGLLSYHKRSIGQLQTMKTGVISPKCLTPLPCNYSDHHLQFLPKTAKVSLIVFVGKYL